MVAKHRMGLGAPLRALVHRITGRGRLARGNAGVRATIDRVCAERLSYLNRQALEELADVALRHEADAVPGAIIEAGCALGGSALVLASAKSPARPLYVYDVFGMIPAPSEKDGSDVQERYEAIHEGKSSGIGGDRYYGYVEDLYTQVRGAFDAFGLAPEANGVTLVQGLYQDTLQVNGPVSLAHIDCDWYESVMVCLERIWPHLVPGGVLVIDDFGTWSGCDRAVNEFFARQPEGSYRFDQKERLHVVRS